MEIFHENVDRYQRVSMCAYTFLIWNIVVTAGRTDILGHERINAHQRLIPSAMQQVHAPKPYRLFAAAVPIFAAEIRFRFHFLRWCVPRSTVEPRVRNEICSCRHPASGSSRRHKISAPHALRSVASSTVVSCEWHSTLLNHLKTAEQASTSLLVVDSQRWEYTTPIR